MRVIYLFVLAVFQGWPLLKAQNSRAQADELFGVLATRVLADLETDSLNPTVPRPYATGWVVRSRADRRNISSLLTKVLKVTRGRAANPSDTVVEKLELYEPVIREDSANIFVDRGRLWCAHGTLSSVGMVYEYHFRRSHGTWRFIGRYRGVIYDPPPPDTSVTVSSCIPAYAR